MEQDFTIGKNNGFKNEMDLKEYIDDHYFCEYNDNIKNFLRFLFKSSLNLKKKFFVLKTTGQVKPDLEIKHNNITKYISIKVGSGNSVHQESIKVFFPFIENLFGDEILNYLKLFHYGDDTIDDTGKERYSAIESKKRYSNQIEKLNDRFNNWSYLNIFLDRFLFKGNTQNAPTVDYIYYGTIEKGLWASCDEIKDYFKGNDFKSSNLHFAALTYQVWGRDNNRKAIHPERRYIMQIKWGSIEENLKKITEER